MSAMAALLRHGPALRVRYSAGLWSLPAGITTAWRRPASTLASPSASPSTGVPIDASPEKTSREDRFKVAAMPELKELPGIYLELSKARLAGLVVLSTMAGYALAPGDANVPTLLATTVGTGLCIAAANTFNQWIEAPFDGQMGRTLARPLVRRAISPLHAATFGAASAVAGTTVLYTMVNPLTAALGFGNIFLYALSYTMLKRSAITNTWVGSVVGAIPPVMGWTACVNGIDTGAVLLAYLLYAWQFPHFNALSWRIQGEYSRAGYHMTSIVNSQMNTRVALRHSVLLWPTCLAFSFAGVTTDAFLLDSSAVNLGLIYLAYKFYKDPNDKSSRTLFFGSLLYLPAIVMLMLLHKKKKQKADSEVEGKAGDAQLVPA